MKNVGYVLICYSNENDVLRTILPHLETFPWVYLSNIYKDNIDRILWNIIH